MIFEIEPGETRADFIRRVVAAARKPTPEELAELRRLLPPSPMAPAQQREAA